MSIRQGLLNAYGVSKSGFDLRSQTILFLIYLHGSINHNKWKYTEKFIRSYIDFVKSGPLLTIKVKSFQNGRLISAPFQFRAHNFYDYQSISECFGSMYSMSTIDISDMEYLIDAGGNIGAFTRSFLESDHSFKEVVLVEPDPDNYTIMCHNTAFIEHSACIQAALDNKKGEAVFSKSHANMGHLSDIDMPVSSSESFTVKTETLSDIIPASFDLDKTVLKLDIEGAEYSVLPEFFQHKIYPKYIIGEIHTYLKSHGDQLIDLIKSHGYQVDVEITRDHPDAAIQFYARRTV
ncbi:FkbM family methyltransferase [Magnetococcus sp. PR-3]|uniref:FkbM family methyltransferase n=1 Tax=Magnetococcus sp. PR-3 TaxID=3120355 RepID=UPI002FCE266D